MRLKKFFLLLVLAFAFSGCTNIHDAKIGVELPQEKGSYDIYVDGKFYASVMGGNSTGVVVREGKHHLQVMRFGQVVYDDTVSVGNENGAAVYTGWAVGGILASGVVFLGGILWPVAIFWIPPIIGSTTRDVDILVKAADAPADTLILYQGILARPQKFMHNVAMTKVNDGAGVKTILKGACYDTQRQRVWAVGNENEMYSYAVKEIPVCGPNSKVMNCIVDEEFWKQLPCRK